MDKTRQRGSFGLFLAWRGRFRLFRELSWAEPRCGREGGEGNRLFLAILGRVFGLLAGLACVEIWSLV